MIIEPILPLITTIALGFISIIMTVILMHLNAWKKLNEHLTNILSRLAVGDEKFLSINDKLKKVDDTLKYTNETLSDLRSELIKFANESEKINKLEQRINMLESRK